MAALPWLGLAWPGLLERHRPLVLAPPSASSAARCWLLAAAAARPAWRAAPYVPALVDGGWMDGWSGLASLSLSRPPHPTPSQQLPVRAPGPFCSSRSSSRPPALAGRPCPTLLVLARPPAQPNKYPASPSARCPPSSSSSSHHQLCLYPSQASTPSGPPLPFFLFYTISSLFAVIPPT